jgi:hypothetical protein
MRERRGKERREEKREREHCCLLCFVLLARSFLLFGVYGMEWNGIEPLRLKAAASFLLVPPTEPEKGAGGGGPGPGNPRAVGYAMNGMDVIDICSSFCSLRQFDSSSTGSIEVDCFYSTLICISAAPADRVAPLTSVTRPLSFPPDAPPPPHPHSSPTQTTTPQPLLSLQRQIMCTVPNACFTPDRVLNMAAAPSTDQATVHVHPLSYTGKTEPVARQYTQVAGPP